MRYMHIDFNALDREIHNFESAKNNNYVFDKTQQFKSSTGDTFNGINKCLEEYDKLCTAMNGFFAATNVYLNNSYRNLKKCEANNRAVGRSK